MERFGEALEPPKKMSKARKWLIRKLGGVPVGFREVVIKRQELNVKTVEARARISERDLATVGMGIGRGRLVAEAERRLSQQIADFIRENDLWERHQSVDMETTGDLLLRAAVRIVVEDK